MNENQKALEVLKYAIKAEFKAFAFYNFIANKIDDKEVRFLCKNLAQDEKLHRLMLEDRYSHLSEGRKLILDVEYKFEDDPSVSFLDRMGLLKLAIDYEIKAQQYYLDKSKQISDDKSKQILLDLYNTEQDHERKLTTLLYSKT
jgi:rubrerythrin